MIPLSIQPPIIAHRGASQSAPENTLRAMHEAKRLGFTWIECDVMLTADESVVVIHDFSVDRTTNGQGLVYNTTLSDIKKLDAGSWFHPTFSGETIPTLTELLAFLSQLQLSANIEIKSQVGKEQITAKKVLEIIQTESHSYNQQLFLSSFSIPILEYIRSYSKNILMGLLIDEWRTDWKSICDALQCITVNVNHAQLTLQKIRMIQETNRLCLAYTVNDLPRASQLFSWGIDALFSDTFSLFTFPPKMP